jgi:hypothetical protein
MTALGPGVARKVLDGRPFSRLCRARITAFGGGRAVLEVHIREEPHQQPAEP